MTGAGGQLGRALVEELERAGDDVLPLAHGDWDVTEPPPEGLGDLDLVVHAAAWTDVDGAESDPQGAAAVNVGGTAHVAELGAPLVYVSPVSRSSTTTRTIPSRHRKRSSCPRS